MRVVGIDQSYTGFGFCIDGESKKRSFTIGRYPGPIQRLKAIRGWFEEWLTLQNGAGLDLVVMEGYANAAKFGREQAGELGGVVKLAVLDITGEAPLIVPPTSLKKFVTGKGNAAKNQMLMGVYKQWGQEFSDDNQADAYALEQFGKAFLFHSDSQRYRLEYPSKIPTQYQIEAIQKVREVQAVK